MSKRIDVYVMFDKSYNPYAIDVCTAAKCIQHNLMERVERLPNPEPVLLLYPFADDVLRKDDINNVRENGIYLIDAPWENLVELDSGINKRVIRRRLGNVKETHGPYNESDYKITTAGAAGITLYRMGFFDQAKQILDVFPWKNDFIRENLK